MIQKFKRLDQAATISSGKKKKTKTVRPEQNISQLRLVSAPSSPFAFCRCCLLVSLKEWHGTSSVLLS